jgi:hypothetical protein
MLAMRPNCECCDKDLPADQPGALICSFECTFCQDCAEHEFDRVCPNCLGQLFARPPRAAALLGRYPPETERRHRADPCGGAQ